MSLSSKADHVALLTRALVETVRHPLLILDSSFRVLAANKYFYEMFKISSVETEGRVLYDLGNGQWDIPLLRELLEQILPERSEVNDFEVHHSFPTIGERVVILNARTLVQRPGESPLIFVAIEDVTKRIAQTRDLELSRDIAEGIIQTLRDPLLILDSALNVIAANTAFYESFPYKSEETEGRKIYDVNNKSWDLPELRTLLENTLLINSSFRDFELDHVFPGIGRKVFLLNGQRVYENGEKTEKILLVIADVTERRQHERFIRFQAEALNLVDDAVLAINDGGTLTYWNSGAERLLKFVPKAFESIQLGDICVGIESDSPDDLFNLSTEALPWREYRIRLRDSAEEFYLESSATAIFEGDGMPAGRLVVLRDVTARKKAEIDLNRTNAELELFTSIAAHDLQEPLRTVTMYVQLLAKHYRTKLGPEADEYIAFAVKGAARMKSLLDDLLKYARVQAGSKNLRSLPLNRIVGDVLHDLQLAVRDSHADIQILQLPEGMADEGQMRQVFQNLISNAMKYRSEQRTPVIRVTAQKITSEWVVSVKDNGIGFDTAYADKIFRLFQRLETTTSVPGTGMGLTISKKIIEAHGGRIWAESSPDVGSTFSFTIPR